MKSAIVPCRKKKHVNEVVDMFHALHELHADKQPLLFKHNSIQRIEEHLKTESWRYRHFVFLLDDEVAGFVSLKIWKTPESVLYPSVKVLNVMSIYVKPWARHKKVATKLMEFAEAYAKKHKVTTLRGTVGGFNDASLNMFKKSGYEVESFKMVKSLS
jgi:L-amino acid N-acyltransferase YncA